MGQPPLDPTELLERLRSEHETLHWEPLAPDEARHATDGLNGERSSLDYLHRHWALPDQFDPEEAGGGWRRRILVLFGRLTYRVLGPYFRQERDLLAHMVQVNEGLERRCDELTLRCRQLGEDFLDRQVAESRNLTELALWLNFAHPLTTTSSEVEEKKGEPGRTTSEA